MQGVIQQALHAIDTGDHVTIEGLRGHVHPAYLDLLLSHWSPDLGWAAKDLWIWLLMDLSDRRLEPLWTDGLDSPSVENQAVCIAALTQLPFEGFLEGGGVVPARVTQAIARWRATQETQAKPGRCFNLAVGQGEGPHSARIGAPGDDLQPGTVAMCLHSPLGPLGLDEVRVRLIRGDDAWSRTVWSGPSRIPAGHDTLHRSWQIRDPGHYTLQVVQADTEQLLAERRFVVR